MKGFFDGSSLSNGVGEGGVYCYDAIGSYERELARASGSASALIQPFLDNQVGR
jgi:20S proteasome subunit beta 6